MRETHSGESLTIPAILDRVEKMMKESTQRWGELCAPYINEEQTGVPYDEDYEDTLERKYQEGFSEAASLILTILKDNIPAIVENIQRQEGCDVLEYLSDLFEGVEDTDIWSDYFGEESN